MKRCSTEWDTRIKCKWFLQHQRVSFYTTRAAAVWMQMTLNSAELREYIYKEQGIHFLLYERAAPYNTHPHIPVAVSTTKKEIKKRKLVRDINIEIITESSTCASKIESGTLGKKGLCQLLQHCLTLQQDPDTAREKKVSWARAVRRDIFLETR